MRVPLGLPDFSRATTLWSEQTCVWSTTTLPFESSTTNFTSTRRVGSSLPTKLESDIDYGLGGAEFDGFDFLWSDERVPLRSQRRRFALRKRPRHRNLKRVRWLFSVRRRWSPRKRRLRCWQECSLMRPLSTSDRAFCPAFRTSAFNCIQGWRLSLAAGQSLARPPPQSRFARRLLTYLETSSRAQLAGNIRERLHVRNPRT